MRSRRDHLGTGFEVWTGGQSWFWCLLNPRRDGGAIGAAATEADAVREAFVAIEEMSTQHREDSPALHLPACRFFTSLIAREAHRELWISRLDRVAEYLANA
ncbi:MAG: hypothetical protein WB999_08200 [Candidatus Binataceae bacterium]|jgi:hypothetical protein